jgi:hypothetical protein
MLVVEGEQLGGEIEDLETPIPHGKLSLCKVFKFLFNVLLEAS